MSEEEIKIKISEALSKCYGIEIKEITRNENSTVGNVYNIKSKDKNILQKFMIMLNTQKKCRTYSKKCY